MNYKCSLVALVAIVGFSSVLSVEALEMTSSKFVKNLKKINAHLDKMVQSDDPDVMMQELKDLLNKQSSETVKLEGPSFEKTLKMLVDLRKASLDENYCRLYVKTTALEKLGKGIKGYSRLNKPNYVPTKVYKLIEAYAYKVVRKCNHNRSFNFNEHVYGLDAYEELSKHLSYPMGRKEDRDEDIAEIKRYIAELQPQDGVVVEAGKKFLALESTTLNEDSCNEKGYEIILKNDLAMRNKIHIFNIDPEYNLKNLLRLERHVLYYVTKHEEICRPIASESFRSAVKTLDQDTYRKVLALVSSHYLNRDIYPQVIESVNEKEVDQDFTIPLMNERALQILSESDNFAAVWRIQHQTILFQARYLLRAFINSRSDNNNNNKIQDPDEKSSLMKKYLFKPCEKYLKVMKPIVEVNSYGMPVNYPKSAADELAKDMTYNMVYAGYQACMFVSMNKLSIDDEIQTFPL